MTADQDAVRAPKVTAVLIKRCRTVLTEHCRYISKHHGIANTDLAEKEVAIRGFGPTRTEAIERFRCGDKATDSPE